MNNQKSSRVLNTSSSMRRPLNVMLFAIASLAGAGHVRAQTTFTLPTTFSNYATGSVAGAPGGLAALGGSSIYLDNGSVMPNSIQPATFGQSFTVFTNGTTVAGTGAWGYEGLLSGSTISAGTSIPISYNFSVAKNLAITGDVNWVLYFRGGTNNSEVQVASGTLADAGIGIATSATFSGNASNYSFTTAASAGETYRAYIGVSFAGTAGAAGQGLITVAMTDGGYLGQGITLNASAIPEPSTYAAIFGGLALAGAMVHRRRQRRAV